MHVKTINAFQQNFLYKASLFVAVLTCAVFFSISAPNIFAEDSVIHENEKSPLKDVRILIDISGSMKKTDPSNLRQPAVKLFASLLPNNVYSGVWTFGKWVNMLIPHGLADRKWKSIAIEQAKNINSNGLFTNIEEALRRSTWDWKEYDPGFERTIIILSDGVVDISNDSIENIESRERILASILSRLINAKVKIHTIALSSLSDKSLLQQLSSATGGLHETIETTTDLDKIFMHIFDVATPRDELPLIDNKVKVDKSINEITFLAFRKNKHSKTIITSPSGNRYGSEILNNDLTWHSEKRYDLVTITTPEAGIWTIDGDINPDNRVLVVTNLQLIVSTLPNYSLLSQSTEIYAHLESENKIIKNRDFLHFVRMKLKQSMDHNDNLDTIRLKDNGKGIDKHKKDGIYSAEVKNIGSTGKYNFKLSVNGTTFKRINTQNINFVDYPVSFNTKKTKDSDIFVSVIPYQSLIDADSMKVTVNHSQPGGTIQQHLAKKNGSAEWSTTILTRNIHGNHKITIHVEGKNNHSEKIDFDTNIIDIYIGDEKVSLPPDTKKVADNEEMTHVTTNDSTSWTITILIVFMFNFFIVILGFVAYKLWKKFQYKLIPHPCEEMINAQS